MRKSFSYSYSFGNISKNALVLVSCTLENLLVLVIVLVIFSNSF